MLKRLTFVAITIALAFAAAGCTGNSSTPTPTPTPTWVPSLGATTLDKARANLPGPNLQIIDLSLLVAKSEPSYNGGQPDGDWVVIAECPLASPQVGSAIGVIKLDQLTPSIREQAAAGKYQGSLYSCS